MENDYIKNYNKIEEAKTLLIDVLNFISNDLESKAKKYGLENESEVKEMLLELEIRNEKSKEKTIRNLNQLIKILKILTKF